MSFARSASKPHSMDLSAEGLARAPSGASRFPDLTTISPLPLTPLATSAAQDLQTAAALIVSRAERRLKISERQTS